MFYNINMSNLDIPEEGGGIPQPNDEVRDAPISSAEFDKIWKKEEPRLRNLARRYLRREQDIDDVLQEVAIICLKKGGSAEDMAAWLGTVTVHKCLQFRKYESHRQHLYVDEAKDISDVHSGPLSDVIRHDLWQQYYQAVEALRGQNGTKKRTSSERDALILVLADLEQYSNQEIADVLGESMGTVKSALHRAREALRHQLAPVIQGIEKESLT